MGDKFYFKFEFIKNKNYLLNLKAELLDSSLIEVYLEISNVGIHFYFNIVHFLINNYSITILKFKYH